MSYYCHDSHHEEMALCFGFHKQKPAGATELANINALILIKSHVSILDLSSLLIHAKHNPHHMLGHTMHDPHRLLPNFTTTSRS
jgi:hypothetical protein